MDLDIIRQEIDQIDDQIVKLLEERMHLVEDVVAYKKASGKAILDTKREEVIFEKVVNPPQKPVPSAKMTPLLLPL